MKKFKLLAFMLACVLAFQSGAVLSAGAAQTVQTAAAFDTEDFDIDENGVLLKYSGSDSTVLLPLEVREIGEAAFKGNESLENIMIESGTLKIGDNAFESCTSLKTVMMSAVDKIGKGAFAGCISLDRVVLSESVSEIGKEAFLGCTSLGKITLPDSVETVDEGVFADCEKLSDVTCSENMKNIPDRMFEGCKALEHIDLPGGINLVGKSAFRNCTSLTGVNIPYGVETIDEAAFEDCTNMSAVIIPETVRSIGAAAFRSCESLTAAILPEGMTKLDALTFANCTALTSVYVPDTVKEIDDTVFHDSPNVIVNCWALSEIDIFCSRNRIMNNILNRKKMSIELDGTYFRHGDMISFFTITTYGRACAGYRALGDSEKEKLTVELEFGKNGETLFLIYDEETGATTQPLILNLNAADKTVKLAADRSYDASLSTRYYYYGDKGEIKTDGRIYCVEVEDVDTNDCIPAKFITDDYTVVGEKASSWVNSAAEMANAVQRYISETSDIPAQRVRDAIKDFETTPDDVWNSYVRKYGENEEARAVIFDLKPLGLRGDVDGDKTITALDANMILRQNVFLLPIEESGKPLYDVDGDGVIDNYDALEVLRYSIGMDTKEKIGEMIYI